MGPSVVLVSRYNSATRAIVNVSLVPKLLLRHFGRYYPYVSESPTWQLGYVLTDRPLEQCLCPLPILHAQEDGSESY